jgi:glycerol-3-phosphate O-acyltransferase 3/4
VAPHKGQSVNMHVAVQVKDRKIVAQRMKERIADPDATPLLVFPEGTCVNNEYTVMFKRGAFDVGATICPIAIKYNKIFVDAFWNSRRQPFTWYIVRAVLLAALSTFCVLSIVMSCIG